MWRRSREVNEVDNYAEAGGGTILFKKKQAQKSGDIDTIKNERIMNERPLAAMKILQHLV